MIKQSTHHRIKGYLLGLCFLFVISVTHSSYLRPTETAHASTKSFHTEILSWIRTVGQTIGLSSLDFEIHGASLQVSEMLTHLGPFLPPAVRDWSLSGEMTFDLTVAATASHESGGTTLDLDLRLGDVAFSSPDSATTGDHLEGKIHVTVTIPWKLDQPTVIRGAISLDTGTLLFDPFRLDFEKDPLRAELSGSYDPHNHRFAQLSVHFQTPSFGEGTIEGFFENVDDPKGEMTVSLGPISNERAFDLLVKGPLGHGSPVLRDLSVDGETRIRGLIRGSPSSYSIQGLVEMSGVDLAIPTHQIRANGVEVQFPFAMEFPAHGRSVSRLGPDVSFDGVIRAEQFEWKSQEWRDVAVPVAFSQNTLLVGQVKLPILGGTVALEEMQIRDPLGNMRAITVGLRLDRLDFSKVTKATIPFTLSGSLEGNFSEIKLSEERLATEGNLTIRALGGEIELSDIRARIPFSGLPNVSMDVLMKDINLEEASLGPVLPAAILNWTLSADMVFDLISQTESTQGADPSGVRARVHLKSGAFSSPDETKLGENLQGEIHIGLGIPAQKDRPVTFEGGLNLQAGEILLESFYINLQQDPLRLYTAGLYDIKNRQVPSLSVRFDAPTLGEGTVTAALGSLDHPRGDVKVALGPISNRRAFDLFVREPFGQILPMLKDISISGETRITASVRGSPIRYSIQGVLEASVEDLAVPAYEMKAKGVKLQFPVFLRYPEPDRTTSGTDANHSMKGSIKGEWIQWKSQEWRDVTVPLTLTGNTLFLPPRFELPIWGGAVVLEGAKVQDPFGKTMEITVGLRLDGLDLSEVTKATAPFALPGSVESNFPEIRVSKETMATRGNLTIHTLGGQIEVTRIHGGVPFSRLRKVSMDVSLKDIDLEAASRSLKFGQMGGIIEGRISDLTFSFGQPEKFELEIHSVRKRGVKQYVNAEAVNNLSILSTGSAYAFTRPILQLFEYYPYSRLGIYCKLENDIFILRGTIHKDGVEYLIKRELFRGIDVINQNPENRIRWKQMLRRLKAIGQGTADVKVSTQK